MSNQQAVIWIGTFLAPFILAVANRPRFTSNQKRWIMVAYATLLAVAGELLAHWGDLTAANVGERIVETIGAVQIWFSVFKAIPVGAKALDVLEFKTSGEDREHAVLAKEAVNEVAEDKYALHLGVAPSGGNVVPDDVVWDDREIDPEEPEA